MVGLGNVPNVDATNPVNIVTTSSNRFVTDTNISTWNAKQNALGYTPENIANKGQVNGYASLDSNGLVPFAQIPPAAIERLKIVANQTARYALTTTDVQNGDTVQQTDTGEMWFVIDQTNLNNSNGYAVYTAHTASSVAWTGVTGVPIVTSFSTPTDAQIPSALLTYNQLNALTFQLIQLLELVEIMQLLMLL